jgi:hypothetical protein
VHDIVLSFRYCFLIATDLPLYLLDSGGNMSDALLA